MARSGEILESPAAGIRLIWRRTSAETDGHAAVAEVVLEPVGFVPSLHLHPRQQQRLEVLQGALGVQIGEARSIVGPGTRLTVPPGVPHRFWNADATDAQVIVETTPALHIEALVELMFALVPKLCR